MMTSRVVLMTSRVASKRSIQQTGVHVLEMLFANVAACECLGADRAREGSLADVVHGPDVSFEIRQALYCPFANRTVHTGPAA